VFAACRGVRGSATPRVVLHGSCTVRRNRRPRIRGPAYPDPDNESDLEIADLLGVSKQRAHGSPDSGQEVESAPGRPSARRRSPGRRRGLRLVPAVRTA
jgi:hypothetical protein